MKGPKAKRAKRGGGNLRVGLDRGALMNQTTIADEVSRSFSGRFILKTLL